MKSFFVSIFTAVGALFGFHSHATVPATSTPVVMSVQNTSSRTSSVTFASTTMKSSHPTAPADPDQAQLIVTSPSGSEILHPGQTYNITWKREGSTTINFLLNLEFIADGLYIREMPIGLASSTKESYEFTIPKNVLPRTNYQIYLFNAATGHVLAGSQAFTIN